LTSEAKRRGEGAKGRGSEIGSRASEVGARALETGTPVLEIGVRGYGTTLPREPDAHSIPSSDEIVV